MDLGKIFTIKIISEFKIFIVLLLLVPDMKVIPGNKCKIRLNFHMIYWPLKKIFPVKSITEFKIFIVLLLLMSNVKIILGNSKLKGFS